jgi:hypothetical protein
VNGYTRMTAGSPRYPSSILHELGTRIVVSKVRTSFEAQRALARGADLLAGEYYGPASSEVRFSGGHEANGRVQRVSCAHTTEVAGGLHIT